MVGAITHFFKKGGKTTGNQAQGIGDETTTPEQPTTVTLYGKIPLDLTNFSYIVGSDALYNAGFRPLDFILLTIRQNRTSAEVPAYIVGTSPMEDYTKTPTMPSSEEIAPNLSDIVREDMIKQSLRIHLLRGNGLLTEVLRGANMQGGDEVVTAEVSLRYRLPNDETFIDRATLLQRISDAYPPSVRPHFNGIQLPMPLKQS